MNIKKLTISIFALFLFLNNITYAKTVHADLARKVALNFYYEKLLTSNPEEVKSNIIISESFIEKSGDQVLYYIFNINKGFIIISGDDDLYPVVGYSFEGNYNHKDSPPAFEAWMENFSENVQYVRTHQTERNIKIQNVWQTYSAENFQINKSGSKVVSPLLSSKWNQNNGYNSMCPAHNNGPGGFCYAGCVATAMAQIMYYYKYPTTGIGSHSYNHPHYGWLTANFGNTNYQWSSMSNYINSNSVNAIAELIYHCGVSVNMYYRPDGSSANSYYAYTSFKQYFNYSLASQFLAKSSFDPEDWDSVLCENLDAGKPIYYSGSGSGGGHAFVCDGYQGTDFFHFNYGWSGYNDGYFYLNNMDFSYGQQAIVNLAPYDYPYCNGLRTFTSPSRIIEDGSFTSHYWNNTNCEWLIAPEQADKIILIFNYFYTEQNKDFLTIYDGESTSDPVLGSFSGNSIPPMITSSGDKLLLVFVTDSINNGLGWQVVYKGINVGIEEYTLNEVHVFPNPASNHLFIEWETDINTDIVLELFDITGKIIQKRNINGISQKKYSLDVSELKTGVYILRLNDVFRKVIIE
ncbi:C10 family peptidase [Bacteroidota bacterium]